MMQRSLNGILRMGRGGFLRMTVQSGTRPILMGRKEDPSINYCSASGSGKGPTVATSHQQNNNTLAREIGMGEKSLYLPCAPGELNYIWLRENCQCSKCYSTDYFQTWVHPHRIPADIRPHSAWMSGDELQVVWPDGHFSDYNLESLKEHVHPYKPVPKNVPFLWERDNLSVEDVPRVQMEDFLNPDESGVKELLSSVLKYGFGFVDKVPPTMAATEKVSTRFSHLMPTVYGRMHEITDAGEFSDVAYTQSGLDPHTDMPYLECPPGIITLHVVYHFGEGGESVLLDGYHMAKQLQVKSPDTYKMLTTTPLTISNRSEKRENRYWFTLRVPIIALNPVTNEPETLRYNNYDKAPLDSIPQDQLPEFYSALTEFSRMTEDPQYQLQFKLKPGTVMFVDNHRLIHGRTDYTGRRCIFGTFLPRDDTISAARRLELVE